MIMNIVSKSNNMQKIFLLLIAFCAISSVGADTTPTAIPPLLTLLRKNYDPVSSFSANFSLTIYWSVREKEEKRQGSVVLAPGDRFRASVGGETVVSDGETCWNYTASAGQVVVKRLSEVDRSMLPSQLFARYIVACPFREVANEKGVVQFAWESDSSNSSYKAIQLNVQEKSGKIARCVMTDRNDNTFTYVFSATVFGKKYSKETFEFAIPKNARMVDMRK
jgi:outer membrane lipoprotein-sorting protein